LNLYSTILDCPDEYWERPLLEELFEAMQTNMDIEGRIDVLK
jgi:uncharacterized Rmd1/YagE family protein